MRRTQNITRFLHSDDARCAPLFRFVKERLFYHLDPDRHEVIDVNLNDFGSPSRVERQVRELRKDSLWKVVGLRFPRRYRSCSSAYLYMARVSMCTKSVDRRRTQTGNIIARFLDRISSRSMDRCCSASHSRPLAACRKTPVLA